MPTHQTHGIQRDAITSALAALDAMPTPVTDWEANFLESVMRWGCKSPKQRRILVRMIEQYLGDQQLAAEVLGQERLGF